jgi:phage baseplate assembly protein W
MATINKLYSDLDFTFTKKPVTGDIALSYDTTAVTRSIRNLLQTRHYDRLFNPDLGSNLDNILFENMGPVSAGILEKEILNLIANYEPRAKLTTVSVNPSPDKNGYYVTLSYYLVNATLPTTVTLLLERDR